MSAVFESIIDICAQSESRYGFKIVRLALSQDAYNRLRAELDWTKPYSRRQDGVVIVNGVEVVPDA